MYKIAGTVKYPFGAVCTSDPSNVGLGYNTPEQAQAHADHMNQLRLHYDTDPVWNKDYWKTQPAEWVAFEVK